MKPQKRAPFLRIVPRKFLFALWDFEFEVAENELMYFEFDASSQHDLGYLAKVWELKFQQPSFV